MTSLTITNIETIMTWYVMTILQDTISVYIMI